MQVHLRALPQRTDIPGQESVFEAHLGPNGSIPLRLIAADAFSDARKASSRFADSTSFAPATTKTHAEFASKRSGSLLRISRFWP